MKELKIEVPQGFEVDKEKSTFEKIVFKEINKLPLSVKEIPNRNWVIGQSLNSHIYQVHGTPSYSCLSTKERAKAFLALMQLVELRDAWNGDWKVDWTNIRQIKYCLEFFGNETIPYETVSRSTILVFHSSKLAVKFAKQFKDLIEEAKELL